MAPLMDTAEDTRPLGKDYRVWLRENTADTPVFAPLAEVIKVACEDTPYNNRQGTWPQILTRWLPFVLDNRQYKQSYALIDAAFRHTNALEDQKNWSTTLLQFSTSVRRTVFKSVADLVLESMRTSARGRTLLVPNIQGLFNDPAWVDPAWFDKWPRSKTMAILQHTGALKDVTGALLQLWLKPKAEQAERLQQWLGQVNEQRTTSPSYADQLLGLLPRAWKNQMYEPSVGRAFFQALDDSQLMVVTQHLNKHLSAKAASPIMKDLVTQWLHRPDSEQNWLTALVDSDKEGKQSVSVLGACLAQWLEDWTKIVREKKWSPEERQTLLLCAATQPLVAHEDTLKPLLKREGVPDGLLFMLQSLDVKSWSVLSESIRPDDKNPPALPEDFTM